MRLQHQGRRLCDSQTAALAHQSRQREGEKYYTLRYIVALLLIKLA